MSAGGPGRGPGRGPGGPGGPGRGPGGPGRGPGGPVGGPGGPGGPGAPGRAPVCLCVLCGLPAAGKSTLTRRVLSTAARRGWRVTAVPYDDLVPERTFQTRVVDDGGKLQDTHTEWKLHRQAVLSCIEHFLGKPPALVEQPDSRHINRTAWERCVQALLLPGALDGSQAGPAPLLFLLDDNFYYPSMRYEVYQLARKYSLGFCQVYLQCDLESCISRNQNRSEPVPTDVILEMVKRLESPNPQKNSWETNSISLNTTEDLSQCDIQRVMELISSALDNPLSPAEDNSEQKEADRLKCANSVIHQTDQACRRHVTEAMKTAKANQITAEQMRSLAARLNESKTKFLHNMRTQLIQEDDLDVEHEVKTALDMFEHEKNEILLRIVNENK